MDKNIQTATDTTKEYNESFEILTEEDMQYYEVRKPRVTIKTYIIKEEE